MTTHPVETYLHELRDIRSSGAAVKETSYYAPLANLLNEIGRTLKPRVRCIMTLKNRGAGMPDGGLFTPDQFQRPSEAEPLPGENPSRGVIEVKGTGDDAWLVASGPQVSKYWGKYGQVLVTNYRDFLLIGQDAQGRPVKLESCRLAPDEASFWTAAARPRKMTEEHGDRLVEYLKRVMLHAAPLNDPQEVAWFLASYACEARYRIERADLPALTKLREELEEALGIEFKGKKGEHFFRSTLVQTLFYGVFSAWVLWHKENPARTDALDWRTAAYYLRVPMLQALFAQISEPNRLRPLGLMEVLDWAGAALSRVNREAFFTRFEEGQAVQYFYEPFLEAFDPELRKELGVWYTPPEVVQYMVARVDTVLREELKIEDGLADPRVFVLDPACGTGTYLVEVLKRIHATLREKGSDALTTQDVKRAAKERVFGFEILPAPFVVSHLQLGLLLQNLGAPLSEERNERVGVYLTNSLTGWEPPDPTKEKVVQLQLAGMPELLEERDKAEDVKRDKPILVVMGNPPYNAFAGVSPAEERGLVEVYKEGLISEWGIKKFNLDDLYVRFFRLAERRIAEQTGKGVVCYISNFSYLGDPSFVVMRKRFLNEFDALWFDCMNGDSRETGKITPDGRPDPSVFSTQYNREGIRVGAAIGLMVRREPRAEHPTVRFRQFWGVTKRADLLASLKAKNIDGGYQPVRARPTRRYSFRPQDATNEYLTWPSVPQLSRVPPFNGPVERRAFALISIDRAPLASRMRSYFDRSVPNDEVRRIYPALMMTGNRIVGPDARRKILKEFTFDESRIVRYPFKPLDVRWCYLENLRPLFSEPSPQLLSQRVGVNRFFLTRDTADKSVEGAPFYFSRAVCDYDSISGHARHFPVLLRTAAQAFEGQAALMDAPGFGDPDADANVAALIWMHALAIGYSPAYLKENADGIRQDWPRIPLPDKKKQLEASANLGRQIAALLDTEAPVKGITSGAIRPEMKVIGLVSCTDSSMRGSPGDLDVTAGWGHAGKDGVTMPGKGRLAERSYTAEERTAIEKGAREMGMSGERALACLGKKTCDVYLNDAAYWKNVPERVWDYTIGGYQVIKKWLSYRERDLLGRGLTPDEAREVMNMARRIAAILLLEPALDANYKSVKAACYTWKEEGS